MKAGLDPDKRWYVVRTNVRAEYKAAESLRRAGYDHYLPRRRIEKKNKRTNTYREIEEPLMVRYLFIGQPRFNADWYSLDDCDGVAGVLGIAGTPIPVPFRMVEEMFIAEAEMKYDDTRAARIARKEEARTVKETISMRFPSGKRIRVMDGPFSGFPAEVTGVTTRGEVETLVEIFGRLSPVTFEPDQLSTDRVAKLRQIA